MLRTNIIGVDLHQKTILLERYLTFYFRLEFEKPSPPLFISLFPCGLTSSDSMENVAKVKINVYNAVATLE